jgi:phosphopantothenoylcysteine decarboxylase/phosphopantothenate--cysteine ligase
MKNILIGVSGGIAAYKAANVVSGLRKKGYDVKVVMTENAAKIITPLAFESLSRHDVAVDMWERNTNMKVEHISLSDWADLILVVPATYNIVGKVAGGIADDMLSTVISAFNKTVYFALAMNVKMYGNPILNENIKKLKKYGYKFIEADEGFLACNVNAKGRLKNEQEIIDIVVKELEGEKESKADKPLAGKKILITAGRTEEPLDPIRYFSNRSTGKMGYSLGEEAEKMGAEVLIISGPVNIEKPENVNVIEVKTAEEMYDEVMKHEAEQDIIIASAAVADYRPEYVSDKKIKKADTLTVNFVRNKDILLKLGEIKNKKILVGFAAESENLIENAREKLEKKNLNMIVANSVENFGTDDNQITLIGKDFMTDFEKMDKSKAASEILKAIKEKFL